MNQGQNVLFIFDDQDAFFVHGLMTLCVKLDGEPTLPGDCYLNLRLVKKSLVQVDCMTLDAPQGYSHVAEG